MERIEDTILRNLLYNDDFVRKSLPYLKNDYFLEHTDKILFEEINKFIQKYNVSPTKESLVIELNENSKLQISFSMIFVVLHKKCTMTFPPFFLKCSKDLSQTQVKPFSKSQTQGLKSQVEGPKQH